MRKYIAYFVAIGMLFLLAGCRIVETEPTLEPANPTESLLPSQNGSDPTSTIVPLPSTEDNPPLEETSVPTEPVQQIMAPAVMILDPQLQEVREGDTLLFSYESQKVSLAMPDSSQAAATVMDWVNYQTTKADERAELVQTWAQERFSETGWDPYYCKTVFTPQRIDADVVSILLATYEFTGGMHPNIQLLSASFDGKTGNIIALQDILVDPSQAKTLQRMVLQELQKRSDIGSFLDGYEETVAQHFDLENALSASWYCTENEVVFYFSPYEIAPYNVGEIYISFTYEELQNFIHPKMRPEVSEVSSNFSFNATLEDQIQVSNFSDVYSVTIDSEGDSVALFPGVAVYDVRLDMGSIPVYAPNQFLAEQTVFAAERLDMDDLILVHVQFPDAGTKLRLSMRGSDGVRRCVYLTQSGEDGSILLSENL